MTDKGGLRPPWAGTEGERARIGRSYVLKAPRPGADAVARASGHRAAPAAALLSMGHNSSLSSRSPSFGDQRKEWREARERKTKRWEKVAFQTVEGRLSIWPEGARADFPGIPNLNPNRIDLQAKGGGDNMPKRGAVTEFSHKSRRRLQRELATMKVAIPAFTMALTLPGCDPSLFTHEAVISAFTTVSRRLAASKRFPGVSGFWKRELQSRGAIHYHLLLYGLENDGLRAEFQSWMVGQWTSLFAGPLSAEQREHHRWWHSKPENMQLVRNFSGYFSKYLGKDEATGGLPGRWWGSFNKRLLPEAARADATVKGKATVMLHRIARRYRSGKINAGKHRSDFARLKKAGNLGKYSLSEVGLWRLRSGYDLDGYRNPGLAARQLRCYLEICKAHGVRPGRFRFRGKIPKTVPIVLCGASAPEFAAKALGFVNQSQEPIYPKTGQLSHVDREKLSQVRQFVAKR